MTARSATALPMYAALAAALLLASCPAGEPPPPPEPAAGAGDAAAGAGTLAPEDIRTRVTAGRYLMDLAAVHLRYDQPDRAIQCYEKAIEVEKDVQENAMLHYMLAQALKRKNETARAEAELNEAIGIYIKILEKIPAEDEKTDRAFYYERIGLIYRELGKTKEAVEWAEKIVAGSSEPLPRVRLARLYDKMGLSNLAQDTYRAALAGMQGHADRPLVELEYGSYLAKLQNWPEAKAVLEPLLSAELPPERRQMLKNLLVDVYRKTGELDKISLADSDGNGGEEKNE